MLFVFPAPTRAPFTLADTAVPLDVLFLDAAGRVVGFAPAVRAREPRPVAPAAPYVLAIECAAGTFAPGPGRGAPSDCPATLAWYAED